MMDEALDEIRYDPLESIDYEFLGTSTDRKLLNLYARNLKKARSIGELHTKILKVVHRLKSLEAFKTCDITVSPGAKIDSALVSFSLKDEKWWNMSLGLTANNEGGKTEASASFRNLRRKADRTLFKMEYKPNTKTYGYQLVHNDKFFVLGKWEAIYSFKHGTEELDVNLRENNYAGVFACSPIGGKHKLEIGRTVRTNSIRVENSSLKLINQGLPVNAKNFIAYTLNRDTRDNPQFAQSGSNATITNEFAYGADNKFHKIDLKYSKYFGLTPSIVLQTSLSFGMFFPWKFTKVSINDKYRNRYVKGFNTLGTRKISDNPLVASGYLIPGDNLGKLSNLILESKIHFNNTPGIENSGLVPFVYGSLICEDPGKFSSLKSYFRDYIRASAGFGIGWNGSFGRIEFIYNTKVLSKPGDITSEFQIHFGE
jgi:outer membrane protein assembly factor BamA